MKTRNLKKLLSLALALLMCQSLLPPAIFPTAVLAAGEVCQIVRNEAVVASYQTLDAAIDALQSGDTLKLLGDIDYDEPINLTGEEENPFLLTIATAGHTLNVRSGDVGFTLNLSYANLALDDSGGGAFNLISDSGASVAVYAEYSTATVSGITVEDTGYPDSNAVINASYASDITVLGDVTLDSATAASGQLYWLRVFDGSALSVGGDVACNIEAADGSQVSVGGDVRTIESIWDFGVLLYGGASLSVGGSVYGTASVSGGGELTVQRDMIATQLRMDTSPYSSVLLASDRAVAEVFGDVIFRDAGAGPEPISGAGICARGLPDSSGPETGSTVTVHGNVESNYVGVWAEGSTVTVDGAINVSGEGAYYGIEALGSWAVVNAGSVSLTGAVALSDRAAAVYTGNATVNVTGDITADGTALEASGNTSVSAGGQIRSENGDAVKINETATVFITGDLAAPNGSGILAAYPSQTTLNGAITAATYLFFIQDYNWDVYPPVPRGESKTAADAEESSSKEGYLEYRSEYDGSYAHVWALIPGEGPGGEETTLLYNVLLNNAVAGKAYADPGDRINLMLYGEAGAAATAAVAYDDAVTLQSALSLPVALTEEAGGFYKGDFTVQDGMLLKNVAFTLTAGGKKTAAASIPEPKLPKLRGALRVYIPHDARYDDSAYAGRITVSMNGVGNSVAVAGPETSVLIGGLPDGETYTLEMRAADRTLMAEQSAINVSAGTVTEVTLKPTLKDTVRVRVLDGGSPAAWYTNTVTLRDADSHAALETLTLKNAEFLSKPYASGSRLEVRLMGGFQTATVDGVQDIRVYPREIIRGITLSPGENLVEIDLRDYDLRGTAVLSGQVTVVRDDGSEAPGAYAKISVGQRVSDEKGVLAAPAFQAVADAAGYYTLPVCAGFPATVSLSAVPKYASLYTTTQTIPAVAATETTDFKVKARMLFRNINIRLFTKYIGDAAFTQEVTASVDNHRKFTITCVNQRSHQAFSGFADGTSNVYGLPGDEITVTVKAMRESAIFADETLSFLLPEDQDTEIARDIYLEQKGALIDLRLLDEDGGPFSDPSNPYALYLTSPTSLKVVLTDTQTGKITDARTSIEQTSGQDGYRLWIEKPGTYKLTFKLATPIVGV
ncbi:MAG: hypothetical protein LBU58_04770, partial [Clostridiales bacterium]|nr:hypothetical protein [Clostridiales bacterium]